MPWHVRDVQRLLLTLTIATIGLIGSWVGISGTLVPSRQMLWLAIAIGSVAVGGLGVMRWLLSSFRSVRIRQSRMVDGVAARLVLDEPRPAADSSQPLVTAARMTHFHLADCPLMDGKTATRVTASRRKRLTPCAVCVPVTAGVTLR
jgi:hypothetical protein